MQVYCTRFHFADIVGTVYISDCIARRHQYLVYPDHISLDLYVGTERERERERERLGERERIM